MYSEDSGNIDDKARKLLQIVIISHEDPAIWF